MKGSWNCWLVETNSIFDPFRFEILLDVGIGEVCVSAKIDVRDLAIITYNRGVSAFQNRANGDTHKHVFAL